MIKTQTKIKRSFRIVCKNKSTEKVQAIEDLLKAENYDFEDDTFYSLARRCTHEPSSLGNSLAHYFGYIYIQDRASMLPPVALIQNISDTNALFLDMCASPGSKTSMLSCMLDEKALIFGNEPNSTRLANLRRNLELMQCFNTVTCNYSGEKIPLADQSFDYILLDPPCSGWGTVDKNPNVKEIWTKEKAKNLVALQKQLIKEAYRLVKVGGTIVYSTCTTNIEENENQVLFALEELGLVQEKLNPLVEFEMDAPKNNIDGVWRLETKHQDTQGFFVAKFKKIEHKEEKRSIENIFEKKHFEEVKLKEKIEGGNASIFGKNIYFIPEKAHKLASENKFFKFQGMNIGKAGNLNSQLSAKLRIYNDCKEKIVFDSKEDIQRIYALLNGQSLSYEGKESIVPFYYKDLYLGNFIKKGSRLMLVK